MNFETIKSRAQLVFAGKPIKKAFLFGSHARLESHLNSDLDILVELDEDKVIGMIEYIKIIMSIIIASDESNAIMDCIKAIETV